LKRVLICGEGNFGFQRFVKFCEVGPAMSRPVFFLQSGHFTGVL
jgi:hypothetical protein